MKKTLNRSQLISIGLLVGLLPVMFLQIKSPFNFYDEGFALIGAQRVMEGQAPYRDFWGIYPPGQFYAIAGVFKLFGSTVMTARIYDTLVRFAAAVAVYLIGRKISSEWLARLALVTVGLLLASAAFYAYAVFPALALGMWAVWCWLKGLETNRRGWRIAAGVVLGLTALVRWDLGAYAAAGVTAAGYLYEFRRQTGRRRWLAPVAPLAWMVGTLALTAGLGYAAVGLRSGWQNLFAQVFYFPVFQLHDVRALAYPGLLSPNFNLAGAWMQFYMPLLALGTTALLFGYALLFKPGSLTPGDYGTAALVIFGFGMFNQALSRYDFIHVTPASIAAFLAVCGLAGRAGAWVRGRAVPIAAGVLLTLLALMYLPMSVRTLVNTTRTFGPAGCFSQLEKSACVYVDENQAKAVAYIQSVTRPDQAIFVGNTRHDKIFVGDSGFYYLAGRPVATRYHELHPGVANTLPVQEEIIAELETQAPTWIVLADIWESNEPNDSAVSSGVVALDEYLREHYRPANQFGWYIVQKRTD